MITGRFITLEGGEGVGKTTNMQLLSQWLTSRGIDFVQTREPGGTALGEQIRQLLLTCDGDAPAPMAELLLMFAARAQHLALVIEPALSAGKWVLCDRFTDATYAYQGYGRQLPLAWIQQLEQLVQGVRQPDLTLYLDADLEVSNARVQQRDAGLDRFEREQRQFFERVRQGYLARAAGNDRFRIIDASVPLHEVQQSIKEVLAQWFPS